MLEIYLDALKVALRKHKIVKKSPLLKGEKWTKSGYDQLSRIISTFLLTNLSDEVRLQLGTTISSKTLQNIYKGKYKVSYPLDPRTLNTLTKLVTFLGFSDWRNFQENVDQEQLQKTSKFSSEEQLERFVAKAIAETFKVYNSLPNIEEGLLNQFYVKQHSAYKSIIDTAKEAQKSNWSLSNSYNPSDFEILEFEVVKMSNQKAIVRTKEFWLLCWWDLTTQRYAKRYKNISEHFYVLQKIEEQWKIKTNASLADLNDLEEVPQLEVALAKPA